MFDMFTKPSGKETTKGKIIGILAGIIVGSGIFALCIALELFSPTISAVLALFFFIITTYQVRLKLAKKEEPQDQEQE